ncbi:MAG: hypothetical protein V4658_07350 [Bacteroidota bacterium]
MQKNCLLILFLFSFLFITCKKKNDPEPVGLLDVKKSGFSVKDSVYILSYNRYDTFYIENTGETTLRWVLEADPQLIKVNLASSELMPGAKNFLIVRLADHITIDQPFNTILKLTANGATRNIVVTHGMKNTVFLPANDIADAAFDQQHNTLYFISGKEDQLYKYNTVTHAFSALDLGTNPTCLALSPDFSYAVTGHDQLVTFIDLGSFSVFKAVQTDFTAHDIILNNQKMAYASGVHPAYGVKWISGDAASVFSMMLTHGLQYSGIHIEFDSSGKYIYANAPGVSSANLHKYRISNDTPYFDLSWPYHGEYDAGNKVWLSEKRDVIFSSTGNTFKARKSNDKLDMSYNGRLNNITAVAHLAHNAPANSVYLVSPYQPTGKPQVYVYDAISLLLKNTIAADVYKTMNDANYDEVVHSPQPKFVFCNAAGTTLFVIANMEELKTAHTWALQQLAVK